MTDMSPENILKPNQSMMIVSKRTGEEYRIKCHEGGNIFDVHYSCTCKGWKYQRESPRNRTCSHLMEYLGRMYEFRRIGIKSVNEIPYAKRDFSKVKIQKKDVPCLKLAEKYVSQNPEGYWMSEKFDGVRAYFDGEKFISRQGNVFNVPQYFKQGLPSVGVMTLDGEFWMGRGEFLNTVSVAMTNTFDLWKDMRFMVFDVPSHADLPFEKRQDMLIKYFSENKCKFAEVVNQIQCKSKKHVDKFLKKVEDNGGEGVVLIKNSSKYYGKRTFDFLKVKSFHDAEAVVIGYVDGKKGGWTEGLCGSLRVRLCGEDNVEFCVGSGLNSKYRVNPPKIGKIITFRYQELSKYGVPRFPVFMRVRNDRI